MTFTVTTGFDKAIVKAVAEVVYLHNCIYMENRSVQGSVQGLVQGFGSLSLCTIISSIGLLHLIFVPPPCPVEDLPFLLTFREFH